VRVGEARTLARTSPLIFAMEVRPKPCVLWIAQLSPRTVVGHRGRLTII
jgi:hypothetical protein